MKFMNQVSKYGSMMSIQQVMTELGIGRTTVYNLIHSGDLESVKVGKYRRIVTESFEAYIERLFEASQQQSV